LIEKESAEESVYGRKKITSIESPKLFISWLFYFCHVTCSSGCGNVNSALSPNIIIEMERVSYLEKLYKMWMRHDG